MATSGLHLPLPRTFSPQVVGVEEEALRTMSLWVCCPHSQSCEGSQTLLGFLGDLTRDLQDLTSASLTCTSSEPRSFRLSHAVLCCIVPRHGSWSAPHCNDNLLLRRPLARHIVPLLLSIPSSSHLGPGSLSNLFVHRVSFF